MTPPRDSAAHLDLEKLRASLSSFPIEIAVVFGSRIRGTSHPYSDVDVGIILEDDVEGKQQSSPLAQIAAEVSGALDTDEVDILDLTTAPAAIAYDALASGVLVVGEEETRVALEARYLQQKLDFEPIKREWHEALERRLEAGEFGRA